jgi:restriction system protein
MAWQEVQHRWRAEGFKRLEKYGQEKRKWIVAKYENIANLTPQQRIAMSELYKRLDKFAFAKYKAIVKHYNKIKAFVHAQNERMIKQRDRLNLQRKRIASIAEEHLKREMAAAQELRQWEAAAAEARRKEETEQRNQRGAQRKIEVAALLARFAEVTEPYVEKLATRRTLVLAKDAYGFTSDLQKENWDKEVLGFLKNAIYPEISRDQLFMIGLSPRDLLTREIDRWENRSNELTIDTVHPLRYEQSCCKVLRAVGWDASISKASGGDSGADILADKLTNRLVVQCKLHAAPVSNRAVQEVRTAKNFYTADYAVIVSASGFTPAAEKLAAASGVKLIHHDQLYNIDGILGFQNQ